MQGIVFAPEFVCLIQIPGAGPGIRFEPEVALGFHEVYQVVSICHGIFHVGFGPVAEGKLVVVPDQSLQAFQRPQKDTLFFAAKLFGKVRIVFSVRVPLLCFQNDLSAEKTETAVVKGLQCPVAKGKEPYPDICLIALLPLFL